MGYSTSNKPSSAIYPHGRGQEFIGGLYNLIIKARQKGVSFMDGKHEVPILKDLKLGGWILTTLIAGYTGWTAVGSVLSIWMGMNGYVLSMVMFAAPVVYNMALKPWLGTLRATLVIFAPMLIVNNYFGAYGSYTPLFGVTGIIGAVLAVAVFFGAMLLVDGLIHLTKWNKGYVEIILFVPAGMVASLLFLGAGAWAFLLLPSLLLTMWSGWWAVGPKGGSYTA